VQAAFEIDWREVEANPPDRGVFVELARAACADKDRFGLNESEKKPIARLYWSPMTAKQVEGLYWRPVPPDKLTPCNELIEVLPIDEDSWYVVLVEPNQELTTVWRLHEQGKELYIPSIRKRIKTGRAGKNGHKVTRVIPKPMFPGYGLMRMTGIESYEDLKKVRGLRDLLRDENGKPIVLPHDAVLAILRKETQGRMEFIEENPHGRKRTAFKRGESVRVEAPGNVYDGILATIEKDDGRDRIKVFLGMAKIVHTLSADMVVAA
jgi:transcription antitermination factor NusG